MRQLLILAERAYIILSLALYTGCPLVVILSDGVSEGTVEGVTTLPDFTIVKAIFQVNYIITGLLLILNWKKPLYLLLKDRMILLLIVLILASTGWSTAPEITLNRAIAFTGSSLFGIYFATFYNSKQRLNNLGWAFGLVLISSLLFVVALPKYGIMGGIHAGAWRGIYTHKNSLGAMMALSSITFLLLTMGATKKRWLFQLGLASSVFFLFMSRSSSPLVYLILLLIALVVVPHLQGKSALKMLVISVGILLTIVTAIAATLQAEAVVNIVGKDLTLTGRTELWVNAWDLILHRPWLGYGYNALWADWSSESAAIWHIVGWQAPSSHNGFIELWLGLGLVGVVILSTHCLTNLSRSFATVRRYQKPEYYLPFLLLLFTLLSNITEAPLLDRNSIYWILYVSSTLSPHVFVKS